MEETNVKFSCWMPWGKRTLLPDTDYPGVYLLAHFKITPSEKANPLMKEIIYIGETCSTLKKRWRQFQRTAFQNKSGHSGGETYRKKFNSQKHNLCVAALSVKEENEPLRSTFIRYIERKFIFEFTNKWGRLPVCNLK